MEKSTQITPTQIQSLLEKNYLFETRLEKISKSISIISFVLIDVKSMDESVTMSNFDLTLPVQVMKNSQMGKQILQESASTKR